MADKIKHSHHSTDPLSNKKKKVKESKSTSDQNENFTRLREKDASAKRSQGKEEEENLQDTGKSILLLVLIFIAAIFALALVYANFPKLEADEVQYIKLPRNIEDAKNLGKLLDRYEDKYFTQVTIGFFVIYIFLQTFAIPGSIFLSIISGFLYPFYMALPMVCLCSALGASFCYLLSYMVGRRLVKKYFPQRAADWKKHVDNHREHLFNYILFLRITPFLPNWFINITSPVIDVPLFTFFIGTLLGVAPPSFVFIQAGTTLHKLTSTSEAWSWYNIGLLAVFALVALVPVVMKKQLRAKLE